MLSLSLLLGKKKKKGKTVALHAFLADPSVGGGPVVPEPPKRTTSWADATDDIDTGGEDGVRRPSCLDMSYFRLHLCIHLHTL